MIRTCAAARIAGSVARASSADSLTGSEYMMRNKQAVLTAVIGLAMMAGAAQAQETRVKRADLPPAVEKTVAAQSQGATIRGLSKETENGKTTYELELTVNGHTRDMVIGSDGEVQEIEEETALSDVPEAARSALTAKAGQGKIERVEALTRQGKLVAYEAVVLTGGKRREIQVGPDGKAVAK